MSPATRSLTPGQWLQWGVATVLASITMTIGVLAFGANQVYLRKEGEALERQVKVQKEDQEKDIALIVQKVDKIYELLLKDRQRQRNSDSGEG